MQSTSHEESPSEADTAPSWANLAPPASDRTSSSPRPPSQATTTNPPSISPPTTASPPESDQTANQGTEGSANPPAKSDSAQADHSDPAFTVSVAQTLPQVERAWTLLHDTYVEAGYIQPNAHQLHSVHEAVGPHTAVMLGKVDEKPVSTISAIGDNHKGLPLDEVYPQELDQMREQGSRLIEVGLLGEMPHLMPHEHRGFAGIFELMRYASYFALSVGASDMICGIPPRRARLYHRMLGFTQIAQTKSYTTVKGNPVALLKLNLDHVQRYHQRYRGINYFVRNPIAYSTFNQRFRFGFDSLYDSNLGSYFYGQQRHHRLSDQLTTDQAETEVSGRIESGRIVYPPANKAQVSAPLPAGEYAFADQAQQTG